MTKRRRRPFPYPGSLPVRIVYSWPRVLILQIDRLRAEDSEAEDISSHCLRIVTSILTLPTFRSCKTLWGKSGKVASQTCDPWPISRFSPLVHPSREPHLNPFSYISRDFLRVSSSNTVLASSSCLLLSCFCSTCIGSHKSYYRLVNMWPS